MKRLNYLNQAQSRMNRLKAILFIMMLLAAFPFSKSFSNNLTITNIVLDQANQMVTFDLGWNNSWRKSDWTAKNWDAAWVFVKWRPCTDAATVAFTHGTVSTNVSNHSFSGSTILEPTTRNGTPGIDAATHNTGLMLRRATDVTTGTVTATVTMNITNMPTSGALDFRAFGIEMVFVPTGAFTAGDGDGNIISSAASFVSTPGTGQSAPNITGKQIISENLQTIFDNNGYCNQITSYTCWMTAAFPKGYGAFYMMKHEISQGQYTDFLNTINTDAQATHFTNSTVNTASNRMSIIFNITPPLPYYATRPDRACNFLSWNDFSAYCDWAALRPLTELEYEKACRGTEQATPFQKAWGITTGTAAAAGGISGAETGLETITTANANINTNNISWTSGDANSQQGPLRCGIFATSGTATRIQTGMGFYGNMELSGNVAEYYITVRCGSDVPSNPCYGGVTNGDGVLNNTGGSFGYHNNATWPTVASPGQFIIRRGGSWSTPSGSSTGNQLTNISNRDGGSSGTGDNTMGGRAGR